MEELNLKRCTFYNMVKKYEGDNKVKDTIEKALSK